MSAIQQNCTHTDHNIVIDRAAVEDCAVADCNAFSDTDRVFFCYMDHGKILNIGVFSDNYGCFITAQYGVVPDTAAFLECDVSDDPGAGGNEDRCICVHERPPFLSTIQLYFIPV